MNDVIVECKGGVVQEVTVLGKDTRVFVIDWDDQAEAGSGGSIVPWPQQHCSEPLAPETRALYEKAIQSK